MGTTIKLANALFIKDKPNNLCVYTDIHCTIFNNINNMFEKRQNMFGAAKYPKHPPICTYDGHVYHLYLLITFII